jgi:hypothetical protein
VIFHKRKLDDTQFFLLVQLHQQVLACERRNKEIPKLTGHNVHLVERDSSDDESAGVYIAELVWSMQDKPLASSLHLVQKNRQEVKFTFNVVKCDRILVELLKSGNIKVTHTIHPLDELNRRAYCQLFFSCHQ